MLTGEHLLTEQATVTARTPTGARDDYGNTLVAETARTVACWHYQIARTETTPEAEQTYLAFFPPGDTITTADAVTIAGETFEVIGPPSRPVNPRTFEAGLVQATLRRSDG